MAKAKQLDKLFDFDSFHIPPLNEQGLEYSFQEKWQQVGSLNHWSLLTVASAKVNYCDFVKEPSLKAVKSVKGDKGIAR